MLAESSGNVYLFKVNCSALAQQELCSFFFFSLPLGWRIFMLFIVLFLGPSLYLHDNKLH